MDDRDMMAHRTVELSEDGQVLVAQIPYWTGRVVSAARTGLTELVARAEAFHSSLWLLESHDGRTAEMVVADDPERVFRLHLDGGGAWDRAYCITHVGDMLSRSRCLRLAAIFRERLGGCGLGCIVPAEAPATMLDERSEADMRVFADQAIIALTASRPVRAWPAD